MRALFALLLCLCAGAASAQFAMSQYRMDAQFAQPTDRYQHGVFGRNWEYGRLIVSLEHRSATITLPPQSVFEDLAPRVEDIGGERGPEIIVIETDVDLGAQVVVYRAVFPTLLGRPTIFRVAQTIPIGRTHRWLAIIGIADFNGDGQNDIAYVETPHLGKTLRIVTLRGRNLDEIASISGVTNHRFGDNFISGGVRDCGAGPEVITADGTWQNIVATRLVEGVLLSRNISPYTGRASVKAALNCP